MPRPVQYNTKVKMVEMPPGYSGEGFYSTSFDKVQLCRRLKSQQAIGLLPLRKLLSEFFR